MEKVTVVPGHVEPGPRPAIAIGNFDGVHLGHQALVAAAVRGAGDGMVPAALSFDPHPARILKPETAPPALMTSEQKAAILEQLGLRRLYLLPFNREVAALEPEAFARRYLRDALRAGLVVVGSDFRFGRGRAGDVETLRRLGGELDFEVEEVAAVALDGSPVSSTRIRDAVIDGRVTEAARLLGRPFFVEGEVVRGAGRGRTLGIPTANVRTVNELLPKPGVYAGTLDAWPAVINLGRNPTFGGEALSLEAHALGEAGDLYGRTVRVAFHERLRDEQRFSGPAALLAQIHADIERARVVLAAGLGV